MIVREDLMTGDGTRLWVNQEADIPTQRLRMLNLLAAIAERETETDLRLAAADAFLTHSSPKPLDTDHATS